MFLIGTNWKMNKTRGESAQYAKRLKDFVEITPSSEDVQLFIIPSFLSLASVLPVLRGSGVRTGVQNVHASRMGAFTGEVSALQAVDAGAEIALIGHSERRSLFGETDEQVNAKTIAAVSVGLTALVCVGERAAERDAGCGTEYVVRQVKVALHNVPVVAARFVWIAYEPVWAIGIGGEPASPGYAQTIHSAIRAALSDIYPVTVAEAIPILYGGSVDTHNAADYIGRPNIDGLFVGRNALDVEEFVRLVDLAVVLREKERSAGAPS